MSAPHYYNAYPALIEQIDGIVPNQEKHDTFIDIEPRTGVAMSAHKRIQVWKSKGAAQSPWWDFYWGIALIMEW